MSLIKQIKKATIEEWWEVAKADPKAGFYQTPAWLEVAQCSSEKNKNGSLIGELTSGTKFVVPLCSYSRMWPLSRIYSVYDQCYGGLLSDGPVTEEEYAAILNKVNPGPFSSFDLVQTPGIPHGAALDGFQVVEFTGSEIELEGSTFDELFAKYTPTHRTNYRKGVKSGFTFRRADPQNLAAEFEQFYEIYLETLEGRWKENVEGEILDKPFLDQFAQVMGQYPDNFYMWFAELDGKPVSVATAFVWNGRCDGWVMASRPAYFKQRPTVFVITEIIKYACEQNFRLFHFGPNTGKQGLIDFKRRFGAHEVPYQVWHRPSPVLNFIESVRK